MADNDLLCYRMADEEARIRMETFVEVMKDAFVASLLLRLHILPTTEAAPHLIRMSVSRKRSLRAVAKRPAQISLLALLRSDLQASGFLHSRAEPRCCPGSCKPQILVYNFGAAKVANRSKVAIQGASRSNQPPPLHSPQKDFFLIRFCF